MRTGWFIGFVGLCASTALASAVVGPSAAELEHGAELFRREWIPNDPRSAAGHGLGDEANAESCVACHSLGGVGGAGGRDRNVGTLGDLENRFGGMQARMVPIPTGGFGNMALGSPRNPPALFGAGLIDRVPAEALFDLANTSHPDHPEITGRVSELDDGRVGRFAWKGHVSSLSDFVAQACEVELGLVVEHPDGPPVAHADLLTSDVLALTSFVGALAVPEESAGQPLAEEGEAVFHQVGCAACHVESVGPVERVFSDLLLHDMGPGLSDAGFGYAQVAPSELVAVAQEWRTPPLWGLRDSAPYLHDGRAATLELAIASHGGEADQVVINWRQLPTSDKTALNSFLRSLTAPL